MANSERKWHFLLGSFVCLITAILLCSAPAGWWTCLGVLSGFASLGMFLEFMKRGGQFRESLACHVPQS